MKRPSPAAELRKTLALQWDACIQGASWSIDTWLVFKLDGVRAELMVGSETRYLPAFSEIHLAWRAPNSLRVAPEEFTTWIRRLIGSDDLKIGHRAFDRAFWIEATDSEWARKVLSEDIQTRILGLRELGPGRNRVCVDVNSAGIRARVFRNLGEDAEALNTIIQTGLSIFRLVRGPVSIVLGRLQAPPDGVCPVCMARVDPKFLCPGCRTPHHAECWKYSGGCGVFACSGRARRAKRS